MPGPVLIGLSGAFRSGKDTTADLIVEWGQRNGVIVGRKAFADSLKQSFVRMFFPDASVAEALQITDRLKHTGELVLIERHEVGPGDKSHLEHRISGRVALQRYGTECHREMFGSSFWTDQLLPLDEPFWPNFNHTFQSSIPSVCVVTDVRFDDEAQRVLDLGGSNWKIERRGFEGDDHASEQGISNDLVQVNVHNNFTLDVLKETVNNLCDRNIKPLLGGGNET